MQGYRERELSSKLTSFTLSGLQPGETYGIQLKTKVRRKIRLIESNAKCPYSKKLTCKATHLTHLAIHLPYLATHLPHLATHLPYLAPISLT
jgi:hypothetical protein